MEALSGGTIIDVMPVGCITQDHGKDIAYQTDSKLRLKTRNPKLPYEHEGDLAAFSVEAAEAPVDRGERMVGRAISPWPAPVTMWRCIAPPCTSG